MNGFLILTGVELEARTLARELELPLLPAFAFPVFGREAVRVAPVGLQAGFLAERRASLLQGFSHPLIISAGVCGGLDPFLKPGDLVVPESVLGPGGERLNVTPSFHRAAQSVGGAPVHTGSILTARSVAATPAEKRELREMSGAVAVDMESSIILEAAQAAGCPSLVVRGVSDDARHALSRDLTSLVSPEGRLCRGRAVALAIIRPSTIPEAILIRRNTRKALHAVARLLASLPVS